MVVAPIRFWDKIVIGPRSCLGIKMRQIILRKIQGTCRGIGQLTYNHWVWLGVVIRGDPTAIWLMEVGVTQSAEVGRVPPMEKDIWREVCLMLFLLNCIILMTDGAACYQLDYPDECPAVVQHYKVNHSEHEWTRPEPHVL